jgi:glycosyltransferase involved in cell wall biosynthesis
MISVLTLTYQRHHLLEEAIYSFLNQTYNGEREMVILNDCKDVTYEFNHPLIRIINLQDRFTSVGKKLEYGFQQCKGNYMYRLDDDDLLVPWGLELQNQYHKEYPDNEIYRCQKHYFYSQNEYQGLSDSINNGNCYTKDYINRIEFPDKSIGEDNQMTFFNNAKIHIGDTGRYSMIYRWGMGVYHISGMGDRPNEEIYEITDRTNSETGHIILQPIFRENYWLQLP